MPAGHIRLSEAITQYLNTRRANCAPMTVKQDQFVTRRFLASIGDIYVENLQSSHVENYFMALLEEHVTRDGRTRPPITPSTWNNYFARIKSLTTYLQARGYTRHDLMRHIQPQKVERRIRQQPSPSVMWQMLDAARDARDRALLATACNTGLRAGSLADLRLGDVDLDGLTLRVRVSKSHLEDDMPMTSDLAIELRDWLKVYREYQVNKLDRIAQATDYLFPARRTPTWKWITLEGGTRSHVSVPGGWDPLRPVRKPHVVAQDALQALGLPRVHEGIHTIRRGAARALFDSLVEGPGYDGALRVVSSFLHHSNVSTTETYLGLTSERRTRDLHLRGRSLLGPRPGLDDAGVVPLDSHRT